MNNLVGKTVKEVSAMPYPTNKALRRSVCITFDDGTKLSITPYEAYFVQVKLIEPTLTNDVIPIGANSLREGSV